MAKKVEIFVTYELPKLEEKREKLREAQIPYYVKVGSNDAGLFSIFAGFFSSSRRARGSFGQDVSKNKLYRLYVDVENEELAIACMNKH